MLTVSMIRAARSIPRAEGVSRKWEPSIFIYLHDLTCTPKAFGDVLSLASVRGAHPTADDVRAVVSLAYLSLNPDFPALNLALFSALNGNWTLLSYDGFGPAYTSKMTILSILCLDARA